MRVDAQLDASRRPFTHTPEDERVLFDLQYAMRAYTHTDPLVDHDEGAPMAPLLYVGGLTSEPTRIPNTNTIELIQLFTGCITSVALLYALVSYLIARYRRKHRALPTHLDTSVDPLYATELRYLWLQEQAHAFWVAVQPLAAACASSAVSTGARAAAHIHAYATRDTARAPA